jgi:hypothetical protein
MEWEQNTYREYLTLSFAEMVSWRRFGNCIIYAARDGEYPILIIEEPWQRVTLCRYEDVPEREEDIRYLRSLDAGPPNGWTEAGRPVRPRVVPPSLSFPEAKEIPTGDSLRDKREG